METISGFVTSTKQFVWCNQSRCEQRDVSSAVSAQFFTLGERISGVGYFLTADHLANDPNYASKFDQLSVLAQGTIFSPLFTSSIREMTNSGGVLQSQLAYDVFGRASRLQGSLWPDFQFGDYYYHLPSGLNMTLTRPYSSDQGRFISRDSIEESGGTNLYSYMNNHPEIGTDPEGTCATAIGGGAVIGGAIVLTAITMMAMSSGAGKSGAGSGAGKKIGFDCTPDPECDPPFLTGGLKDRTACHAWCNGCKNVFKRNWCRLQCDLSLIHI